jgi:hypothetical protein
MPKASQQGMNRPMSATSSGRTSQTWQERISNEKRQKKIDDATSSSRASQGSTKRPGKLATAVKGSIKQIGKQFQESMGNAKPIRKAPSLPKAGKVSMKRRGGY